VALSGSSRSSHMLGVVVAETGQVVAEQVARSDDPFAFGYAGVLTLKLEIFYRCLGVTRTPHPKAAYGRP